MPRRMREKSSSKIYHVMIRGNERKNIFLDEEDKARFIDTIKIKMGNLQETESSKSEKKFNIYAYCLMDNHVHLLINEEEDNIGRIMKRINTSYAYYFNKKYSRIGHLFQDRYKSEAIENDNYLLAVIRYIHNNPVKAEIVKGQGAYKWSSYNEYMKQSDFIESKSILEMFSKDEAKAKELFKKYSTEKNEYIFIEYEDKNESKAISGEKEANEYIGRYLKENEIDIYELKGNKKALNELIINLKRESNLSIRTIADMLMINRGMVQRVKT